jgi:hypothetical protein
MEVLLVDSGALSQAVGRNQLSDPRIGSQESTLRKKKIARSRLNHIVGCLVSFGGQVSVMVWRINASAINTSLVMRCVQSKRFESCAAARGRSVRLHAIAAGKHVPPHAQCVCGCTVINKEICGVARRKDV